MKRKQQKVLHKRKFDTTKLHQPSVRAKFTIELKNRYYVLQDYEDGENCVEEKWQKFEDANIETSKKILGYKKKGSKPWISKESWELVEERKKLKSSIEQPKSERIMKISK